MLRRSAACSFLLLVIASRVEAEESSIWQEAVDPSLAPARPMIAELRAVLASEPDRDRLEAALLVANRLLTIRPRDPQARHLRGRVLDGLGRWSEAASDLREALRIEPDGPIAHEVAFDLGVVLTRLQQWAEAARAYRRFLEETPWPRERAIASTNLAETLMGAGRLEEAIAEYRLAVATEPRYTHGHLGLAVALDRQGDAASAREAMLQALSTGAGLAELDGPAVFFVPAYEAHYYRALAAEVADEVERALHEWRSFLAEGGSASPYADRVREHIEALGHRAAP